jgi:hypothetical protein
MKYRAVRRLARVQSELFEQAADSDTGSLVAYSNPDCPILVMDAHGNHSVLEARVTDAGHGQQQFSR